MKEVDISWGLREVRGTWQLELRDTWQLELREEWEELLSSAMVSCQGLVVSAVQVLMLPPSVDPIGMGSEGWHPSMEFILAAKLVEL